MTFRPDDSYWARRAKRRAMLEDIRARHAAVAEGKAAGAAKWKPRQLTDEERFAQEFPFAARDRRREQAEAEHRARRRDVEAEVASRDRLYRSIRDTFGKDYADGYLGGGDAA